MLIKKVIKYPTGKEEYIYRWVIDDWKNGIYHMIEIPAEDIKNGPVKILVSLKQNEQKE